ncbi:flavin reductase [Parabacteroides sp. PF5-9]|uniref:flavin reductase family protein n=1 Tax=Parabacteroides sp. PF5-9 TaxID=1742404 RepID=UPI002476F02A|nr:flavin reductase [Parabacteroides sp. PF5-9]MDH6356608.1 flavin reductase (DIM6/NTAB) family NADH-FMN oxidoreductase RutF [Parabacteroides sp. PF5-9]
MKKNLLVIVAGLFLVSCGGSIQKSESIEQTISTQETSVSNKDVTGMGFDELFKQISAEDLTDNVFKLVGKDYTVITAGNAERYNSMTASFGGWGQLFSKPTTWCFLRANRYTLEVIREENSYTMSYFADEYKDQVLFFGSKTGKDTDKMKETTLTMVQTPSGNISYKQARLIIECKLTELTTVKPDDFYTQEGKDFVTEAYEEVKDYHKLVFGEITNVWVKR